MKHLKKYNESKIIDYINDIEDTLIESVDKSIIELKYKSINTLINKISLKFSYIINFTNINNENINNVELLLSSLKTINRRTNCKYDLDISRKLLEIDIDLPILLKIDSIWYYSKCIMVLRYYLKNDDVIARIEMVNYEREEFLENKEDIIKDCINRFKVYNLEIENIEVESRTTMPYVLDFKINI